MIDGYIYKGIIENIIYISSDLQASKITPYILLISLFIVGIIKIKKQKPKIKIIKKSKKLVPKLARR